MLFTKVKDTGIGINESTLEKIGCIFGNLDMNTNNGVLTQQGIGIGLLGSKLLSEKLGGNIHIQSVVG